VVLEALGELEVAAGEDGCFEGRNALQTPGGVGDRLNQIGFTRAYEAEIVGVSLDVLFVGRGVVTRKQDSATRETCFDGMERGYGFP